LEVLEKGAGIAIAMLPRPGTKCGAPPRSVPVAERLAAFEHFSRRGEAREAFTATITTTRQSKAHKTMLYEMIGVVCGNFLVPLLALC